jgi:hypothetical protein
VQVRATATVGIRPLQALKPMIKVPPRHDGHKETGGSDYKECLSPLKIPIENQTVIPEVSACPYRKILK